jgi:flavin reductase (DIM6/NTAB) family NADH-FMN oxidoreductase RutF
MTANSFTSVSLRPPLVLVSIANNARMSRVLERGMPFGISVLADDQRSVSQQFAGAAGSVSMPCWLWRAGVPLIAGALAQFVCRVVDARVVGDHTLQIGEVEHFERFDKAPLVFYSGAYHPLCAAVPSLQSSARQAAR